MLPESSTTSVMILPPSIYQKLEKFHKLYYSQALVDLRINRWTVVVLVYTALVLDNILLTVVGKLCPNSRLHVCLTLFRLAFLHERTD